MIGWIGSVCFALCGLPQVIKCVKDGHACNLSMVFLLLWLSGEILYVIATLSELGFISWMLFNYVVNIVCIVILVVYKVQGRSKC
jgi:uncharacterized protein with PQ loop repeat